MNKAVNRVTAVERNMKTTREWVNGGQPTLYYYVNQTGRIIGETAVTGTGTSCKYSCVVYPNAKDSLTLGMYISSEKAKNAIEHYWYEDDRIYSEPQSILE